MRNQLNKKNDLNKDKISLNKKQKDFAKIKNNLVLIIESLIVGMLAGLVISLFRKGIIFLSAGTKFLYSKISFETPQYIFFSFALVIIFALIIGKTIKKYPVMSGSGISQLKGNFLEKVPFFPWPELPLKFIGGVLSIGSGLSVGKAGPAIQIGAYLGSIFEQIGKSSHTEKICLVTSGAAAGLAGIFGAPFASVLFAIEGLHQYLTPLLLTCIMAGAFSGNFVSSIFFGQKALFDFSMLDFFPKKYFGWLILLGIIIALVAYLFKQCIHFFDVNFSKFFKVEYRPIIPFVLAVFIFLLFPFAGGGDDELINILIKDNFSFKLLCLILIIKIIFTGLCLGSGVVGGVFFPALTCGALVGAIFFKTLVYFNFIEASYYSIFVFFAMSAFLTSAIKAPMTGIILLAEISGELYYLDGIIITCLAAYILTNFISKDKDEDILLSNNFSIEIK